MLISNYTLTPELKNFLDDLISTDRDDSTVTVVPLRCGLGKSTYIAGYVTETLENDSSDGLIVVTDSVERLCSYTTENKNVTTMTADNVAESMQKQSFSKVLLMTTQRFFALTRREIQEFLIYKHGKRSTILIDERPILRKDHQITIKDFNDVDSALQLSIDDRADQTEKTWCIAQWQRLKDHVQSVMDTYETITEKSHFYLWHTDEWQTMTADDSRFFKFIESNRERIATQKFTDAYNKIHLIHQIITDGAVFSCFKHRSGQYLKTFTLMINHREKITNLGVKVFVLDSSADIEPSYSGEHINMVECSQFNDIPLDNLTINCVNINTSKNHLSPMTDDAKTIISVVKSYISKNATNPVIFTYKDAEDQFKEYPTAHFGNIKGSNEYREYTDIVQIGLNRFPELAYFTMTDEYDFNTEMLKMLPPEKTIGFFEKIFDFRTIGAWYTEDVMFRSIFADIEQNLFRGSIRNPECTEKMTSTLFFDTIQYAFIIELMKERYGSRGAVINIIDTPPELKTNKAKNRKTEKPTAIQIFYEWYDKQPTGRTFSRSDVLHETTLSTEQFKNIRKRNKELFSKLKTTSDDLYIIT